MEQPPFSQRLAIVGTTHVNRSSIERVRRTIMETRPSVVAVELDEERLQALRDPEREKLSFPIHSGLLPWLLALLERSVGSLTDVFPGSEMLEAVDEAERVDARIVMIDKPIGTILADLSSVPLLEKCRIAVDVLFALLAIGSRWKATKSTSASLDELMAEFDAKYPTLSRILVKERDRYMADRLKEILQSTTGRIVGVVGLGHVNGITQHLAADDQCSSKEKTGIKYEWTLDTAPR